VRKLLVAGYWLLGLMNSEQLRDTPARQTGVTGYGELVGRTMKFIVRVNHMFREKFLVICLETISASLRNCLIQS